SLGRALHFRFVTIGIFLLLLGATYWVYQKVPRGFVPQEDQNYFITVVQAPEGASLEYTANISAQAAKILGDNEEALGTFAVSGFSFSGRASNRALIFTTLKPISKREGEKHSAAAIIERVRGRLAAISGALVIPFEPPPVNGVSEFGGFQFV